MITVQWQFLTNDGAVEGVPAAVPGPDIAQGSREVKLVMSWPKGLPGLGTSDESLGGAITAISGGRLKVQVFGAGQLVSAFEVFDAVSSGVADMYHSAEYYWEKRSPGFNFFAAVPFGFTADEMAAWIHFGGGQALWDELIGGYNIKPLPSTYTGVRNAACVTKAVTSVGTYRGMRFAK